MAKMKITKRAKSVYVRYEEQQIIEKIAVYTCSTCMTQYRGFGPSENVTRFKCRCGQELIVLKK